MEPKRSSRILELDGLRAFAAFGVILSHMIAWAGSLPKGSYWYGKGAALLGPMCVHVFFIISGYIITSLLMREQAKNGRVSLTAFYIRRSFRILPPFALYLAVLLVLMHLGTIAMTQVSILGSALFLGNTGLLGPHDWFVEHTWSLSVEEQFYLFFPPLLCLIFVFNARKTTFWLGVFFALCVVSLKVAHELSLRIAPPWICISGLYGFRYIIVGVLIALHGRRIPALLTNKSRLLPLGLAVLMVLLQLPFGLPGILSLFTGTVEPFLCGLFVIWFMQNPARCSILRWPPVQWLGACSYSIYLWQQLFTGDAVNYSGWAIAQSPLLAFVAIMICATVSYYLIERPGIWLGHLFSNRVAKNAAAV